MFLFIYFGLHRVFAAAFGLSLVAAGETYTLAVVHRSLTAVASLVDFPGGSDSKESAFNAGDARLIPGSARSLGGGNSNPPTLVFLSGKSHGQRRLAGYSSWGHKELNTT